VASGMTNTYNTGNPVGSTDPRDLYDNASNFDEGMNAIAPSFTDRKGVLRKAWSGMETEFNLAQSGRETEFQQFLTDSGFVSLGNYASGIDFTAYNQYMARDGFFYRPAPSSIPFTTTGTWVGGDEDLFNLFSADDVLRQDLAADDGAGLVGYGSTTVEVALGSAESAIAAVEADILALSSEYVRPQDFGAAGDGVADDTEAVQAAIADGGPVYWGDDSKVYRLTSGITKTLTRNLMWSSNGATIKLDSASSIETMIQIATVGFNVHLTGQLTIDANLKAFSGIYFVNSSTSLYSDMYAEGLRVRNIYRTSDVFAVGGTGIRIRGGYRNIMLVRPDVRNVKMAEGAGVIGFRGVAGISITAMTLAPQEVTIIHPYVDGVYSEDPAYTVDQDGIVLFTNEDDGSATPFPSHFSIFGGKFKNCGGRSIKSQMEFGQIIGTHFQRNNEIVSITRQGSMPEIDFQTGGGLIENIECLYQGSVPQRIIQLTGSRQETPVRYIAGVKVDGVRISRTGANPLVSLVDIAVYYQKNGVIDLKNINQSDSVNLTSNAINIGGQSAGNSELIINVENLTARVPVGSAIVKVNRPSGTTHLVGRNILASQIGTEFSSNSGAGTMTTILEGRNIRIV
jgi:hypothetical protein